jgi:hypothetical protein
MILAVLSPARPVLHFPDTTSLSKNLIAITIQITLQEGKTPAEVAPAPPAAMSVPLSVAAVAAHAAYAEVHMAFKEALHWQAPPIQVCVLLS